LREEVGGGEDVVWVKFDFADRVPEARRKEQKD